MCRILAVSTSGHIPEEYAFSFKELADVGRTIYGTKAETERRGKPTGHRGGWGLAISREGTWLGEPLLSDVDRDPGMGDASARDSGYAEALNSCDLSGPGVLISHLRRPSSGQVCNRNTHPFRQGKYVFCHNGAISWLAQEDRSAPSEGLRNDSRAFFNRILTRLSGGSSAEQSLFDTCAEIHKEDLRVPMPERYTSLTCALSDGQTLWVVRDVNPAQEAAGERYFTMYLARTDPRSPTAVACQEPISVASSGTLGAWESLGTRELVSIRNGTVVNRTKLPS